MEKEEGKKTKELPKDGLKDKAAKEMPKKLGIGGFPAKSMDEPVNPEPQKKGNGA